MLRTAALQPYNIIKHRVRAAIRTYQWLIRFWMISLMAMVALWCFTFAIISMLMILLGNFTFIVPMSFYLMVLVLAVPQIRNSMDMLVEQISAFIYYAIQVIAVAWAVKLLINVGVVNGAILQVVRWFAPPIIFDAVESK